MNYCSVLLGNSECTTLPNSSRLQDSPISISKMSGSIAKKKVPTLLRDFYSGKMFHSLIILNGYGYDQGLHPQRKGQELVALAHNSPVHNSQSIPIMCANEIQKNRVFYVAMNWGVPFPFTRDHTHQTIPPATEDGSILVAWPGWDG